MVIKFIILIVSIVMLTASSQAAKPFNYHEYYVEQGWHYGCDPNHLSDRLFRNYRNGKELY